MKAKIIIGTRGSELALWQSQWVKAALQSVHGELEIELKIIQTTGDKILDTALSMIGDKGLFTKEIEQQLLAGNVDLAVHSLKDLPTKLPEGLVLGAVTAREDPADVLVSKNNLTLEEFAPGAVVLTGSLRRRAQLLRRRGDLEVREIRGNVPTRLRKLDESDADGVIMAAAGLKRLGFTDRITQRFEPAEFLPACGQGALGLEIRQGDAAVGELIEPLNDAASRIATTAERAVLAALEGGCQIPMGAYAELNEGTLCLRAMIAALDGSEVITTQVEGSAERAEELGREAAQDLLGRGGREMLDRVRQEYEDYESKRK